VTQYLATSPNHRQPGAAPLRFTKRPGYVDVKVKSVRQLPKSLHRLR
jgi:putative hydrolase of the HAD superfamily